MNWNEAIKFFKQCRGVLLEKVNQAHWGGTTYFWLTDSEIVPLDDQIYMEITGTQTKGTIGILEKIEVREVDNRRPHPTNTKYKRFDLSDTRFMLRAEGRSNLIPASYHKVKILPGYTGPTRYIRTVAEKVKKEIPAPINKFKQELKVGAWAVGASPHKEIRVGKITRWTAHNVWAEFEGDEFRFDSVKETLLLPEEELLKTLTFAKLVGWRGR